MKAIVYERYGPPEVLELREVEKPSPGAGEVLLEVCAASVNPLDWHFMRGTPYVGRVAFGLRRPRFGRLGADVAGRVESVGPGVTRFKAGDEVFGSCRGALAEYVTTPETALAKKPGGLGFDEAAAVPVAGFTALQSLRDRGRIQPGQRVLVNGAAGGVGTMAVQIARSLGAEVTGVCSAANMEMVRSLGARHVIDYARQDFTTGSDRYDLLLDLVLNHPLRACRRVLAPRGIYLMIGGTGGPLLGPLPRIVKMLALSPFAAQRFAMFMARRNEQDLAALGALIESGRLEPIVDRRYPLGDAAEAVRYLEAGHARGKVIIKVR